MNWGRHKSLPAVPSCPTGVLALTLPAATSSARDYVLEVEATPLDPQTVNQANLHPAGPDLPTRFALEQNRPNPFEGSTAIRFALPVTSPVRLEIFDPMGRRLRTLASGRFAAGYHTVEWDRRDAAGNLLRPGLCLYRISAGSFHDRKKMVLLGW